MEPRKIKGSRSPFPQWHRQQNMIVVERLFCICGAVMYEGPKPKFTRISCPKCKRITEIGKEQKP